MKYNNTSLACVTDVKGSEFIDLEMNATEDDLVEAGAGTDLQYQEGSVSDALICCLRDRGRVDIPWIAAYAATDQDEVIRILQGSIYQNPDTWDGDVYSGWEMADQYLSGNLRDKLLKAREAEKHHGGRFEHNISALEAMLPPEIRTEDIYVTLGSPWIPEDVIDEFVDYLIRPHSYHRYKGTSHDASTGKWELPNFSGYKRYVRNTSTFGTEHMNAIRIIEKTLNMKQIRVTKEVSSSTTKSGTRRVLDQVETAAAQEKQQLILSVFKRWIWKDKERKERLRTIYETRFACSVIRRFDGGFLDFPGMTSDVQLYPYQKNAVARILFTPNTLLAHDVGAGKTFIMIAAAMELKRLGMAEKSMFVVPNNLVSQWRSIFRMLYPEADILCIEPPDMRPEHIWSTRNRIVEHSGDGIIIAYSCFDRIPLSRQEKDPAKEVICFDELGIDRLFVDEAHNYKNVSVSTSISGILGIRKKGSVKCDSMMAKVNYVQRRNSGGGVVMATGTPITNSVSDIFIFQKYLQNGELTLLGLQNFDSWVGMFAEKTTEFEIAVDTGQYRLAERFSRFHNIPELTTILASIADFHSMDDSEAIPEFEGYSDIRLPQSGSLKTYLEKISRRADRIHRREVSPEEDNMLKITIDGRKAALDIRLVQEEAIENAETIYGQQMELCKVSACAEQVAEIWHHTKQERLTQLIFCDISTPKVGFNIYDDLRQRLIDLGVNAEEIAYIHEAKTDSRREKLFRSMRDGHIRILIGSTFKLGLGVNVQERLLAIHHLDLPWRPADMVQREGRILRTGNQNEKVKIFRYIAEGSFDAYSWQLLETKQRFIVDLLSGSIAGRNGGDVDDTVLNYAEAKALALGNPLLKSRVEAKNELTRLSILQRENITARIRLEQRYSVLPDSIAEKELELAMCSADAEHVREVEREESGGLTGIEKKYLAVYRRNLRDRLASELYRYIMRASDLALFDYKGFTVVLPAGMDAEHPYVRLVREGVYHVDMGDKKSGVIIRLDHFLGKLEKRVGIVRREKEMLQQELEEIEVELSAADSYADKIDECTEKLEKIDKELGVTAPEK